MNIQDTNKPDQSYGEDGITNLKIKTGDWDRTDYDNSMEQNLI